MRANHENGFELGQLDDLSWGEIEGRAAETTRDDGDVCYRGRFLCTVFNDERGGDILDEHGRSMTDEQVQASINAMDLAADGVLRDRD